MIVVAILSIPFLFILARKPVLRRLALRNASRRPRETVLVVLGALLGTAIMTGSYVVGDTFDSSIRRGAYEQLGPIDEVVSAGGGNGAQVRAALSDFHDPDVDGTLTLTLTRVAVATTTEPRQAAPVAQLLETDFDAAQEFGGDASATGISGSTPGPGEAAIGRDLARKLDVETGDNLEAFAYGASVKLRVTSVLPKLGVAGFWRGNQVTSYNVFAAPGTIAELVAAGDASRGAPPQELVLVSNRGSVEGGASRSKDVAAQISAAVGAVPHSVTNAKELVLERATRAGESLTRLYTSIGLFAVLAGILLLVNIFFMLADERKSELGMLRAVGLRRASLIGAFATEGWCYAALSAVAGTFVGLLLGRGLIVAASRLFAGRGEDDRVTLHFDFEWSSVQQGLVTGFVIALTTVVITSVWLSRFNIIQAIRDISEPARRRPRKRSSYIGLGAAVVGLLLTGLGVGGGSFFALLVGPTLVLVGLAPMLARNVPRGAVTTAIAIFVLAWSVAAVPIALALDADIDVLLFVLQGLVLVGAAVVLVSQHQSAIGHALGRFARRSLRVRLGLAYPLARRFRTAMTLGMFALVVFILVMVSVFSAMFSSQVGTFTADSSGGYNVVLSSNSTNPVAFDEIATEDGVRAVAPLVRAPVDITDAPGLEETREWDASGFDESFVVNGVPKLEDADTYPNDEAAYRAVLADPSLAIVDEFFLVSGAGPPDQTVDVGDTFTVRDPVGGATKTFTVAAVSDNDFAENGFLTSRDAMVELLGARAVANRAYVAVDDPNGFADAFAGRFLANGGQGETLRGIVEDQLAQQQQFFLLMRTYLALGLVVGVAGIGVIMVRAVRERRRQVGVLRALGFQAGAVRAAFVIESSFVAIEGVVIGTALALVCTWSITLTDAFGEGMSFRIPFLSIGVLVLGTLICALLATALPARSAARIEPAVALRIAD